MQNQEEAVQSLNFDRRTHTLGAHRQRYPRWIATLVAISSLGAMTALAQNEDPTRPRSARTKEQIERDLNFVLKTEPSGELDASNEEALSSLGSLIGLKVAEAGAGQGYIVEKLARRVGSSGLVYAEDIRADGRWRRGRNI